MAYLSFLFEGTFNSELIKLADLGFYFIREENIMDKARELLALINSGQYPWIVQALKAIERSNIKEGNTVIHMAIDTGSKQILNYIILMMKIRDKLFILNPNLF